MASHVGVEGIKQAHHVAARGAQAGALGGDVRDGGDLDAAIQLHHGQRRADQLVLQVAHAVYDLGDRVAGADLMVKLLVDGDVNVLVDGRREDGAGLMAVEGVQIAAAPGKAEAQRCA